MASNVTKIPAFFVQYYEFEKKVGFPVDMYNSSIQIDGLFEPSSNKRFSLGYMVNLERNQETEFYLNNIGLGIEFYLNESSDFVARSYSNLPVYLWHKSFKNAEEQHEIFPGKEKIFFDLRKLLEHKILPKRIGKIYDGYTFRVSFGKPFEASNKNPDNFISPCWVEMSLNRIVDLPSA